jgi:hypothetical protein
MSESNKRSEIRSNGSSQFLTCQSTMITTHKKKDTNIVIKQINIIVSATLPLQKADTTGAVAFQKFAIVITSSCRCKFSQFSTIAIANTTQSIEHIKDSLCFTRSKRRTGLCECRRNTPQYDTETKNLKL